ncbi:hypothetical protein D1B33_15080 [Lysinibacillus yapensis]|uniref:Uncharacterized protein n=1 Tax=Ureibacillus yapensis TaxID=2304605 RepID=A0A396S4Z3_9BACL|nr:hypothetical protein [Lysinibacillus yapensis]RHW33370.1 hypothetical protein D1B33_15080 [Lysinibacillus yapensis]
MQKINWEMMTQFVFPEQLGTVEEVVSVDIKPIWQQIETEDSVRLVGIYHIAAVARFNPYELPEYSDGTFIEELEFDGNNGYFEYALPLEVDLPREKVAYECQPQVSIDDLSFFVYDGSNCTFKWEVGCQFDETVEGALFQYQQAPAGFTEPPLPVKPELPETFTLLQPQAPAADEPELKVAAPEIPEPVKAAVELEEQAEEISESSPLTEPEPDLQAASVNEEESHRIPEVPEYRLQEPPATEVAQTIEEIEQVSENTQTEDSTYLEQADAEQEESQEILEVQKEEPADDSKIAKGQPSSETYPLEEQQEEQVYDSTSIRMASQFTVSNEAVAENTEPISNEETESETEEETKEKILQSKIQFLPTDTDDFYSELTESYTLFNIPGRAYRG